MTQKNEFIVFDEIAEATATRIADKVSLLMKTTYRDMSQDVRFRLSFAEAVGNDYVGDARYKLSQLVGSILGRRQKSMKRAVTKESIFPSVEMPSMTFVVEKSDCREVILATTVMGEKIVYRRDERGEVVCVSFAANLKQIASTYGLRRAQEIFQEMDHDAIQKGNIMLCERSHDILTMIIGGRWKMVVCRGVRDVIAQVSEIVSGRPVEQSKLPYLLLKEARGIAKWYLWRDNNTRELC